MRTKVHKLNVELDIEDPRIPKTYMNIGFTRRIETHRENYGADADGNRGMMVDMIDEDRADDVYLLQPDGTKVPLASVPTDLQAIVLPIVHKYLELVDPSEHASAYDEPERDYEADED